MNWKEFLKPNILKISLTAILVILVNLYIYWSSSKIAIDCVQTPCSLVRQSDYFLSSIIVLVPLYLIACLISWIYGKIK